VHPLLLQIRQTIARYQMLTPGLRLGIAVSGGPDSLCLLHALLQLRSEFNLTLAVIHIDHNLRGPQSQADAQFVHNLAQQLGLPFHIRTLTLDPARGNLEQEARRARYQFFRDLIREGAVEKIALGHTRSDQAETVLFRLLRGAGSEGLAGVRPVTDSGIIRPLLQVTRPQVEQWLQECNIPWREDETNTDQRFDRNRIRHQLIPRLQSEWNPALPETLAQMADWAFEEEQYWRAEVPRLAADWVRFAKNAAVIDASRLTALPVAAARRLIRYIVKEIKDDLLGVGFSHIEAVRHLAARPEGSGRLQIPGVEVCRSFNWLRFATPEAARPQAWEVPLAIPGRYVVPCTTIELELVRNNGVYNRSVNALDLNRVGEGVDGEVGRLVLRNWRSGDRYQPQCREGEESLKKLFQEHRIPLWERRNWPMITVGERIAWVSRFGPAEQFAVNAGSRTVVSIRENGIDGGVSYV
jgi:tRNA(Ile)-lysidine synthase